MIGRQCLVQFLAGSVLAGLLLVGGGHGVWSAVTVDAFKTWSAITLSFLGGIRFGLGLRTDKPDNLPVLVLVPAAIGWVALFAPDNIGVAVLLLAQCAQGAWDSLSASRGATPSWFGNSRIVWTLLVATAHIAVFVSIY